jgi:hypothetical protein
VNRFDHLGISGVQSGSIPRKQTQLATVAKSEATLPIPFWLK